MKRKRDLGGQGGSKPTLAGPPAMATGHCASFVGLVTLILDNCQIVSVGKDNA